MSDREDQTELFSRRAMIVAGGGGLLFAALMGRMAQLQVFQADTLTRAADDNRFNLVVDPAPRGIIYDRFGAPLAINKRDFRIVVTPAAVRDDPVVINALAGYIRLTANERDKLIQEIRRAPRHMPLTLRENLSWEEYTAISVQTAAYPGVRPEIGEARAYPRGPAFAHLVGYVAKANEKEAENDPLLKAPGVRLGKEGLEGSQEEGLRGKHGALKLEVDVDGRVIREVRDPALAPVPGQDMVLTIDADLQQFAYDRFGKESGAAVVVDVRSGDLIVMTSVPAFDANLFVNGIPGSIYRELLNNERKPLYHKAVRGTYPPGSTFKMMTAIAALEAGVVTPEERVFCRGFTMLGGQRFHCWSRRGHGSVDLHTAIKVSCDIWFYEMSRRAGPENVSRVARAFGLGHRFDIGVPGVARALVPDTAWKERRFKQPWKPGDSFNFGIGQGYMIASPLQLAVMTARLAAGGRAVQPRLIREGSGAREIAPAARLPFQQVNIDLVNKGMVAVSNEAGGTDHGWQDRHLSGSPHHDGRAPARGSIDRTAALEPAQPRAFRRLCAGRCAEICLLRGG
jgi:penicillin-binding protein 2